MRFGIPCDVRMLIEGKIRPSDFSQDVSLPGTGTSRSAMKRRARAIVVTCNKCGRQNCNDKCTSPGYMSTNREDKIRFCRNGLSKDNLDSIHPPLHGHPSGYVQGAIFKLWPKFYTERQRLRNMVFLDPVCQAIRKLEGE